jgi:membrane protease YdiL (CAAX protease family)
MENDLRVLVGLGLTLLLVMLRLEAQRFGAAEYDEPVRGRRPSVLRRIAWYILGVGGILGLLVAHPSPEVSLHLQVGDRSGIFIALLLGGLGVGQAVGIAWYHYRRLRFPDVGAYPGALANEILTAFIDEAVFRGALLGYFIWVMSGTNVAPGTMTSLAILGQAVVYVLATRLGAPGRDRYMFALALVVGLISGWATLLTGGIGASFLGHAITRVAVFLTTGHAGQPPARGTEVEDVERRRRTPEGWRAVDRSGARER